MLSNNRFSLWLKRVRPTFNFLLVHCAASPRLVFFGIILEFMLTYGCVDVYIITSALVGSLLIYAGGNISYIDSLFFATGACTQAGLNTIDVNLLNTWQQVCTIYRFWASLHNSL